MRIDDAIKHAQKNVLPKLKTEDAVALHVLIELAKRVRRFQRPIRQLADVFSPAAPELNQVQLFDESD